MDKLTSMNISFSSSLEHLVPSADLLDKETVPSANLLFEISPRILRRGAWAHDHVKQGETTHFALGAEALGVEIPNSMEQKLIASYCGSGAHVSG